MNKISSIIISLILLASLKTRASTFVVDAVLNGDPRNPNTEVYSPWSTPVDLGWLDTGSYTITFLEGSGWNPGGPHYRFPGLSVADRDSFAILFEVGAISIGPTAELAFVNALQHEFTFEVVNPTFAVAFITDFYLADNDGDVRFELSASDFGHPVPEPSTIWGAFAIASLFVGFKARHRI